MIWSKLRCKQEKILNLNMLLFFMQIVVFLHSLFLWFLRSEPPRWPPPARRHCWPPLAPRATCGHPASLDWQLPRTSPLGSHPLLWPLTSYRSPERQMEWRELFWECALLCMNFSCAKILQELVKSWFILLWDWNV